MVTVKKDTKKHSKMAKNKPSKKSDQSSLEDSAILLKSKNPFAGSVQASRAGPIVEAPITPENPTKPIKSIKSSTGTIKIMSVTPKNKTVNGFQETDATPKTIGFKVRQIMYGGQDVPPQTPDKTKSPRRKGKKVVKEPVYTLPKPKWTQSAKSLEESSILQEPKLYTVMAKQKITGKAVLYAKLQKHQNLVINSNALNFKVNKELGKVPRQKTRSLILQKERLNARNKF